MYTVKILVIDDNKTIVKFLRDILLTAGHQVLESYDAEAGISIARKELPDVILMDINMPIMDGITATRILKTDDKTSHITIIAVTALAMKGDKERILNAGCDDYIVKPVRYRELLEKMDMLANKS